MRSILPHFAAIDWLLIGGYFLFLAVVGFWKRKETTDDYLIAGRRIGLGVFVASLVVSWYGGGILGDGEFVYTDGISAWLVNGFPYYIVGLLFALFLARRVRQSAEGIYTIPDKLQQQFGRPTALVGAALTFMYAAPTDTILMVGLLFQLLIGCKLLPAMVLGMLISVVYVYRGGLLSDLRLNVLQYVVMLLGFSAVTLLLLHRPGIGLLHQAARVPPQLLTWTNGHHFAYFAAWFAIALETFVDPDFHQRCFGARSPGVAAKGILIAVGCWMVLDFLTVLTGFFARALSPGLARADYAYPSLVRFLPHGLQGFFMVGMLAPIMAGTVSYTFIAAMTVGKDFIWRLRREEDNARVPGYTRIGLVATAGFSILVAYFVRSVVEQWYLFGNIVISGLLVPLMAAYHTSERVKAPPRYAFASSLLGTLVSLYCVGRGFRHGSYTDAAAPLHLPPLVLGMAVSAAIYGVGLLHREIAGEHGRAAERP